MPLTVASINVNGIRAALRNGMVGWLEQRRPDVVTLQEVRAPDELVQQLVAESLADASAGGPWHLTHVDSDTRGRAGVAVLSRVPIVAERSDVDLPGFESAGRWAEADLTTTDGTTLTVISCYAHTGDAEIPERMVEKLGFFDAITQRIGELAVDGRHVLLTGDLNVAHRDVDLKNWKGNRGCAGCLPEERVFFDRWSDELGFVDVGRHLAGDGPGPYTWWSYRGRAFDNDAGWRIDYQIASPALAARAVSATVDRSASYAERWSDHAPVVVTYDV